MLHNLSNFFFDWKMQLDNICLDMETKQPICITFWQQIFLQKFSHFF